MQDNHQRIAYKRQKPMIIELNFEKISKTAKNSTAKPQKRPDILPVYIKEQLILYKVFNVMSCHVMLQSFSCLFLLSQHDPQV